MKLKQVKRILEPFDNDAEVCIQHAGGVLHLDPVINAYEGLGVPNYTYCIVYNFLGMPNNRDEIEKRFKDVRNIILLSY